MDSAGAAQRIGELLDSDDATTTNTSMRLPEPLREAAAIAVSDLGAADSTTTLASHALRSALETIVMQSTLDRHYSAHPDARPSLGDLAIAAARLDGRRIALEPDRIRQAALQITRLRPDADADDVILWAEAQSAVTA